MLNRKKSFFKYSKNRDWTENLSIIMQLGLTMAGCIIFCFFIGLQLDKWLNTKGVFITIFTLLGAIGGGNTVYRQILEITKPRKKNKKKSDNGVS